MDRILSLTDFSKRAENAVEAALEIAKRNDAEVLIYHHLVQSEQMMMSLEKCENKIHLKSEDASLLENVDKWMKLAARHKVQLRFCTGGGNFIKSVNSICEKQNIDLIVMGSSGAGGKKEYIWGTNTQLVANSVERPLLVIKEKMVDYYFDQIVFASSFTKKEKEVFRYFLEFLKIPSDALIHLLCIDTRSYFNQSTILIWEAMKDFEKLAEPYRSKSHFYGSHSIDSGIRKFVDELKPDLLVMSNKFEKPLKHMIKGNETIRLINHAEFPVLSVNYPDAMN